jgi:hypothetical protein
MGNDQKTGIDERLLAVFKKFDNICKSQKAEYNIVSDERDLQGYLVGLEYGEKIDKIIRDIDDTVRENDIHIEVDKNHRQGTLFTFTMKAIQEGSGTMDEERLAEFVDAAANDLIEMLTRVALEESKGGMDDLRADLIRHAIQKISEKSGVSAFNIKHGDEPDAKFDAGQLKKGIKVELEHTDDEEFAKKIAKGHLVENPKYYGFLEKMEAEMEAEPGEVKGETMKEDQYKWAPGKVRRKQSMWPQAFGHTASYGGVVNGYAKSKSGPTKVIWKKGVQESAQLQEAANRIKKLFLELVDATRKQDKDDIKHVGMVMKELADGSEGLTNVVTDAVNCAGYFDTNDVGYAYDRFKSIYLTEPITDAPDVRYTAEKGQAVIVKEQFDVACPDSNEVVTIPVDKVGIVEGTGTLTSVLFGDQAYKIMVKLPPSMVDNYLRPVSSSLSKRLNTLISEGIR